eukprot:5940675-Amphidinium_carterae.1
MTCIYADVSCMVWGTSGVGTTFGSFVRQLLRVNSQSTLSGSSSNTPSTRSSPPLLKEVQV